MDPPSDFTLTDLDPRSKAELQNFLQQEEVKAQLRTGTLTPILSSATQFIN